jgi:hypothetical protein
MRRDHRRIENDQRRDRGGAEHDRVKLGRVAGDHRRGRIADVSQATVQVIAIPGVEMIGAAFLSTVSYGMRANGIYQMVFDDR